MTPMGSDRPIIVLGCPRSGTTLMQVMLHSHPRIAIPPETRFTIFTYGERLRFGDLERRRNRRKLVRAIVRRRPRRFRDLGVDRRQTVKEMMTGPPTLGSVIGIVLRAYAARFDKPRWGDKRPVYHNYIGMIMRLFPDAQIVHVVRDPRDCVASLKRMKWWNRTSYHSISAWAQSIAHTDAAIRRWPGAVTRVHYERLVGDPERELRALCAALGEEYDPAMAEPERMAPVAVPERKHWHAQTLVRPTTKNIGKWRSELEGWEIGLCEAVLGGQMKRLGYELTGAGRAGPRHRLEYAAVHAGREARRRKWLLRDRWLQRQEPNPVAALLTSGQRAAASRK